MAAGCDHYLCKPVAKDVLLQALQWAAGQRPQSPLQALRPAPDAALAPDDPAAVGIDPELLDRMPAFLDSRRELLAALEQAAGQGDEPAARRHAHRLAGSLGLYGLHWAAGQCSAIEHGAWTMAELRDRLAALRAHLDGVQSRTQPAARAG
jgi:HPt (histidine-containing phosphotransfer) domain-containing protein